MQGKKSGLKPHRPLTNPVIFWRGFLLFMFFGRCSRCICEQEGVLPSYAGVLARFCHDHRDFLDVLGGCGEQSLPFDPGQASVAGVSVAEELFGVRKRTFNSFLSSFINVLAPVS